MVLADATVAGRAGSVEIPQRRIPQAVGPAELRQHLLDHELRLAVYVRRAIGHIFRNRRLLRLAVHSCRRGKYKIFHSGPAYGFQQAVRTDDVIVVVNRRFFHRFADLAVGGEMHDRVDAFFCQKSAHGVDVMNIFDDEAHAVGHGAAMAPR